MYADGSSYADIAWAEVLVRQPMVGPAGLIVTRQERPWHPSSVLFEGVQVPLPFVFAYTARVVVSQATASVLVGAGSVAVKMI